MYEKITDTHKLQEIENNFNADEHLKLFRSFKN